MTTHRLPTPPVASRDELALLRVRCEQLEHALQSRVVIEQAKGVLSERFGCDVDEAFDVLRAAARSAQQRLHALAAEIVESDETPASIGMALIGRARFVRQGPGRIGLPSPVPSVSGRSHQPMSRGGSA